MSEEKIVKCEKCGRKYYWDSVNRACKCGSSKFVEVEKINKVRNAGKRALIEELNLKFFPNLPN